MECYQRFLGAGLPLSGAISIYKILRRGLRQHRLPVSSFVVICLLLLLYLLLQAKLVLVIPVNRLRLQNPQELTITDGNFLATMEEIWENTDLYVGYGVKMRGFVFDDPTLGPDEFVLARMVKFPETDVQVVGILCLYPQRGGALPGLWLRIEGILAKTAYYNVDLGVTLDMPYVEINKIEFTDKPKQELIYP